jgi:hypothetical protein
MTLTERKVRDLMRGGKGEVTLRFDGDDLAKLPCHCEYDQQLCGADGNSVMLVRKVEVKNPDGSWSPYPSVSWLDGVDGEEQLQTMALLKITGEEKGFRIMGSTNGVPDGELMCAALDAGIYTETIG